MLIFHLSIEPADDLTEIRCLWHFSKHIYDRPQIPPLASSFHCAFHQVRQQITKYVMLMTGSSTEVPDQHRQLKGSYLLTNWIQCWCWAALTVYWLKEYNIMAVFFCVYLAKRMTLQGAKAFGHAKVQSIVKQMAGDQWSEWQWAADGEEIVQESGGMQSTYCMLHTAVPAHNMFLVVIKG